MNKVSLRRSNSRTRTRHGSVGSSDQAIHDGSRSLPASSVLPKPKSEAAGFTQVTPVHENEPLDDAALQAHTSSIKPAQVAPMTPRSIGQVLVDQKSAVKELLQKGQLCPSALIGSEVEYFYGDLGIDQSYFLQMNTELIANHILCVFSAKSFARLSNNPFGIDVRKEEVQRAVYICNSTASMSKQDQVLPPSFMIERRIEIKYLSEAKSWEATSTTAETAIATQQNTSHTAVPVMAFGHKRKSVANLLMKKSGTPSLEQASKKKGGSVFALLKGGSSKMLDMSPRKKPAKQPSSPTMDFKQPSSPASTTSSLPSKSKSTPEVPPRYRVRAFRTSNYVSDTIELYLWFFFVEKASYLLPPPELKPSSLHEVTSLRLIASDAFQRSTDAKHIQLYQELVEASAKQLAPATQFIEDNSYTGQFRLLVCYRTDGSSGFFSGLTNLIKSHDGLLLTRKELEPFHGFTVVTSWITVEKTVQDDWRDKLTEEISLLFTISAASFSNLFHLGQLSAFEVGYLQCAKLFAFYLCAEVSAQTNFDVNQLDSQLRGEGMAKVFEMVRSQEITAWSEDRLRDALMRNNGAVKLLSSHFQALVGPQKNDTTAAEIKEVIDKMTRTEPDEFVADVLRAAVKFNQAVRRTNMYRGSKSALVFEIDPECLYNRRRYPAVPHCLLMIVGSDFRGFHVRFSDIARGGVRLIKSRSEVEWRKNANELLFENYSLAYTQQKKNKDIPEGGSKGVILTTARSADSSSAFKRYIDAILDLIIPDEKLEPERKQGDDMIFIGPDENTADLMDWAASYAESRGLKVWKAFTTGKSVELGGIPHDTYGMTTRSVHQYVVGALGKMGLKEEEVTKCMTGGPDGDLGSNEILISKDKIVAMIDGSGVLYDPQGLARPELERLAKARVMVKHFDRSQLSGSGFLVLIDEKEVTLPDGTLVEDGFKFRNTFHLHPFFTADVFVPCGGRPAAVNMGNIEAFMRVGSNSKRFKLIVEGANLFITQEARLLLEADGVVLFKDASANKGGVTSSSCEVLAALTMTAEEHAQHLCANPTTKEVPEFYKEYAKQVQAKIEHHARSEFECLWREHQRTGRPMCVLADEVSLKINSLALSIRQSPLLWDDVQLRDQVLKMAVPAKLIKFAGGPGGLVKRIVPEAYPKWIFSSFLAAHYIYHNGIETTEFTFMTFVEEFRDALGVGM